MTNKTHRHKSHHPDLWAVLFFVGKTSETGSKKGLCDCLILKETHFLSMDETDTSIYLESENLTQFVVCGTCGKTYMINYEPDNFSVMLIEQEQVENSAKDYSNDRKN